MISVIITAFKEPRTIGKAIESFVSQSIKEKYELIVSAPDEETLNVAKKYTKKNKKIKLFKDPGKGKSYALNLLLPKIKGDIIILSDGDVYVSENSVNELLKFFEDKKVGCVTGKPVSINPRNNLFGYWSSMLCYGAHKMRLKRDNNKGFLECSGYLWAFRNKLISQIPRETAEDSIVPLLLYLRGYKIRYAPKAEVYVKYPSNLYEFTSQKKRTSKAHETLVDFTDVKNIPRMKSLKNEVLESYMLFSFPKNIKEVFWTVLLFPIRLYIWMSSFFALYLRKDSKVDGWQAVKTTK
jgi:cellulose synthase/poly-beta-1,6-N-acetylglucosamine synthase-like glycosyltransferase